MDTVAIVDRWTDGMGMEVISKTRTRRGIDPCEEGGEDG